MRLLSRMAFRTCSSVRNITTFQLPNRPKFGRNPFQNAPSPSTLAGMSHEPRQDRQTGSTYNNFPRLCLYSPRTSGEEKKGCKQFYFYVHNYLATKEVFAPSTRPVGRASFQSRTILGRDAREKMHGCWQRLWTRNLNVQ